MRTNQIHKALAQGLNRFEVCQLVSKGVKATHKTGARFEDTINSALDFLGTHKSNPAAMHAPASQAHAEEKPFEPAA